MGEERKKRKGKGKKWKLAATTVWHHSNTIFIHRLHQLRHHQQSFLSVTVCGEVVACRMTIHSTCNTKIICLCFGLCSWFESRPNVCFRSCLGLVYLGWVSTQLFFWVESQPNLCFGVGLDPPQCGSGRDPFSVRPSHDLVLMGVSRDPFIVEGGLDPIMMGLVFAQLSFGLGLYQLCHGSWLGLSLPNYLLSRAVWVQSFKASQDPLSYGLVKTHFSIGFRHGLVAFGAAKTQLL